MMNEGFGGLNEALGKLKSGKIYENCQEVIDKIAFKKDNIVESFKPAFLDAEFNSITCQLCLFLRAACLSIV